MVYLLLEEIPDNDLLNSTFGGSRFLVEVLTLQLSVIKTKSAGKSSNSNGERTKIPR